MKFEWLAALAYPRSVAVHPNFASISEPTAAGMLASEILQERRGGGSPPEANPFDVSFANACIAALRDEEEGVSRLAALLGADDLDPAQRACAGIVLTAIELERGAAQRDLLDGIIEEFGGLEDSLGRLVHLWLRLGSAVIGVGHGEYGPELIHEIRTSLEAWEPSPDISVPTAAGLDLSPETVATRIADFLADAALRWEVNLESLEGRLWADAMRKPTPAILAGLHSQIASGFGDWSKETFQQLTSPGTRVLAGPVLPGDDNLVIAVLVSQHCFHPFSRQAATDLGRTRFLRAQTLADDTLRKFAVHSSLNLLRFAGHRATVEKAVRYTVRNGPLSALVSDLNDVQRAIEIRGQATHLEIGHLSESAPLLSAKHASSLFRLFRDEFAGKQAPFPERWTAEWARRESVLKCLASLAGPADLLDQYMDLIAKQLAGTYSEDLDRLLALGIRALPEVSFASSSFVLNELARVGGFPELRETLVSRLGEAPVEELVPADPESSPFDQAIRYIDQVIRGEIKPTRTQVMTHGTTISDELTQLKASLGGGQSFGGIEPLDVAVAYATYCGHDELWPLIIDLLQDPRLIPGKKAGALKRLARSMVDVPDRVKEALRDALPAISSTDISPLDDQSEQQAATLRLAAALGQTDDYRFLGSLWTLLSAQRASERVAAISVIGDIPDSERPPWALQTLITSTYDSDPAVQAEATQVLAHVFPTAEVFQELISDRVNDLLARDGTWLLRKVLSELSDDSAAPLRQSLQSRLRALTQHVDWRVRRAAIELLEDLPSK